jgi:methyl-accepting chemotaxis protein
LSKLASRLRIGEKIALSFGLVILIFLGVIIQDQAAFARLSADYADLHHRYGARQSYAFAIERRLNAMRAAQAEFLMTRSLDAVAEVTNQARVLDAEADGLARLDEVSLRTATDIRSLAADYLNRFESIVAAWRIRGLDEDSGLQGSFRRAAHELERLAGASQSPRDLHADVLQLRRREKDYLLRGDAEYVAMVEEILARTADQVAAAPLTDAERKSLTERLLAYGRDFRALIDQDRRIAVLTAEMDEAAARITPLVERNLVEANRLMSEMTDAIVRDTARQARINLMIALGATLLGMVFAVVITARIVRPVRRVAGLLDRLTVETPRERIPTVPGARDEIDAMAAALNTLADHKTTFVNWWRAAMREAVALRDLHAAVGSTDRARAADELRLAVDARLDRIIGACVELRDDVEGIRRRVDGLSDGGDALSAGQVQSLKDAAARLSVLSALLESESLERRRSAE